VNLFKSTLGGVGQVALLEHHVIIANVLCKLNEFDYRNFKAVSEGYELCKFNRCVVAGPGKLLSPEIALF
jgi:hypothetical protein